MPTPITIGKRQGDRLRRALRKVALGSGVALLSLVLIYTAFRRWTHIAPPTDSGPTLHREIKVELVEGVPRMRAGKCWMERRDGLWRLNLAGDPRSMGFCHGLLSARITATIDQHMIKLMGTYVTTPFRRWLVGNLVRWQFRQLPDHIPPRRLVELAGSALTLPDDSAVFPERPFHRIIYYHALHDMTQRLDGSPLVGCTSFAAWGKQTVGGRLLLGRNFDFEGGEVFDREKAVLIFRSPDRIPFVSVAWPGMAGVVTGVNAKQLYVSINAARTDAPLQPGIPMAFLVREILERASSIKQAIKIIREYKVMVPEALLIADGKVPEAVVVELAPDKLAVRRSASGAVGVANHFVTPKFKSDASNDWLRRYTTSDQRYKRLVQLMARFGGKLDAQTVAMIMRNRTGVDDEPLALGNRNALDALIATHGVVADLGRMVLWVSRGPNLLDQYVAVDLNAIFGLQVKQTDPPEPLAADPLKGTVRLKRYLQAKSQVAHGRVLLRADDLPGALDFAVRATGMAPQMNQAHKLRADVLWSMGRKDDALRHYRKFMSLHPPYLKDKEVVGKRLGR